MKTNKTIQTLCSILSDCRTDLGDLALHSKDEKYFYAQLRSVSLDYAKSVIPEVRQQLVPSNTSQFIVKKVNEKNELCGFNVNLKTPQHFFTTLDGFVNADGMPTLVEMYGNEPKKIGDYFLGYTRKLGVLKTLFPKGFGWVLMLPSDYSEESIEPLPVFKKFGGHVSVLSYSASEMQRYIELYKRGSDTRMLVKQ